MPPSAFRPRQGRRLRLGGGAEELVAKRSHRWQFWWHLEFPRCAFSCTFMPSIPCHRLAFSSTFTLVPSGAADSDGLIIHWSQVQILEGPPLRLFSFNHFPGTQHRLNWCWNLVVPNIVPTQL